MTETKPLCACGKQPHRFPPHLEAKRAALAKANGHTLRPLTLCAECILRRIAEFCADDD